jgi:poly-gamma-glutamate synthesis protein (capsule biosynthesis protein)
MEGNRDPASPDRRRLLERAGRALLFGLLSPVRPSAAGMFRAPTTAAGPDPGAGGGGAMTGVTLFLCGDVMTGRGIDQILPHPGDPQLYEPSLHTALGYLQIAEAETGPIPRRVDPAYVWGDALVELGRHQPAARIVNLETAVTTSDHPWPDKEVHYRMHPANVGCLPAGHIDCCVLANNHVLDWGYEGLSETLDVVHAAGLRTVGAGPDREAAAAPAVVDLPGKGRLLILACCTGSAGVPAAWAARDDRAGVNRLTDLSAATVKGVARQIGAVRRAGDLVLVSIHWGGNWGYDVPRAHRDFAHGLIDDAGVDLVHGHSSHHPIGIERYRDRAILYGCGDFLNDYEGIGGHETFRPDLALMYFPTLDPSSGRLSRLELVPMRIRHFRLNRARDEDVRWLEQTLTRQGEGLGTRVLRQGDGTLTVESR